MVQLKRRNKKCDTLYYDDGLGYTASVKPKLPTTANTASSTHPKPASGTPN